MSRRLIVGASLLAACQPEPVGLRRPQLEVSTRVAEIGYVAPGESGSRVFTLYNPGDVRLGIREILLDDDLSPGAFSWTVGDAEGARAIPDDDRTFPADYSDFALVIEPGARVPITVTFAPRNANDQYAALLFSTDGETGLDLPAQSRIYADEDNSYRQVYLHGVGSGSPGDLVVTPRTVDMGSAWDSGSQYIALRNVGGGPIRLGDIALTRCSPGFSVAYAPGPDTVLDGGTASVVEVRLDGSDPAECTLIVASDDADRPLQEVHLTGNRWDRSGDTPPEVVIISPEPGYRHQGPGPLTMELWLRDADQPADTLTCKVKSAYQLGANLANCRPTGVSGHVFVDVPRADLAAGVDVLGVTVIDQSEVQVNATVPVLFDVDYPRDDVDHDGFGASSECDDADVYSYPRAAERYDHRDNNCDFRVDEGTIGFDDDGDSVSEVDGDCDDGSANTYVGAPEIVDANDNDCDGTVDEGTSSYDDDGDEYTEAEGDCNDRDVAISPGATELCSDGVDNDCDGKKDSAEPCVQDEMPPRIVGAIDVSHTTVEPGEAVTLSVLTVGGEGLAITWGVTDGLLDDGVSDSATLTAPARPGLNRVSLIVNDAHGNQTWQFMEIRTVPTGTLGSLIWPESRP